jgi:hypothetical protein
MPMASPLLDAGHRDRKLRPSPDEHADIENPVLLRSDELLAVEEILRKLNDIRQNI